MQNPIKNIAEILNNAAVSLPERNVINALSGKNWSSINIRELYESAQELSKKLAKQGFGHGHRVGIISENSVEWAVTFYALMYLEAVAVPMDMKLDTDDLTQKMQSTELDAVFLSASQMKKLEKSWQDQLPIFNMAKQYKLVNKSQLKNLRPPRRDLDDDIAVLIFTSGTSGDSQCVMLSHGNLYASLPSYVPQANARCFNILPLNHIYGMTTGLLASVYYGMSVTWVEQIDWDTLSRAFHDMQPTLLVCVPRLLELIYQNVLGQINAKAPHQQKIARGVIGFASYMRRNLRVNIGSKVFAKLHKLLGNHLKVIICGAASLDGDVFHLLEAMGLTILEGFGMTETAAAACVNTAIDREAGSVGKPVINNQAKIFYPNESGVGELHLKGTLIMRGYYNNEEATKKMIREGWLATGDLAKINARGNVQIIGRVREMIVHASGKKASPLDVERYYIDIPGVLEVAAVGVPKPTGKGDQVHLVVILDPALKTKEKSQAELEDEYKNEIFSRASKIPQHLQAQFIHFINELPKTSTLKVKRRQLSKMLQDKMLEESHKQRENLTAKSSEEQGETLAWVVNELATLLQMDVAEVDADKHLSEFGVDSLLAMQLVNELNEKFNNAISTELIFSNPTLRTLADEIDRVVSEGSATNADEINEVEEFVKTLDFHAGTMSAKYNPKPNLSTNQIFLTGANGMLGGYVVKDLLEKTKASLYCLVRADSLQHGKQRLLEMLKVYEPSADILEAFEKRVQPVLGDIVQTDLGLKDHYQNLARKIDTVIHIAAKVSLHGVYEDIKPVNVDGAKHVIEFALKTKQKYMCHVSSYSVMGDIHMGNNLPFTENDFDRGQGFNALGYQQSKFEAEVLVRSAQARGLKWIIVRPGDIFGDSEKGRYPFGIPNVTGIFYDILKTVIKTKLAMVSPLYFDMTPVDYVARGLVYFVTQDKQLFKTYHLANPDQKRYYQIVQLLTDCGYEIDITSIEDYMQKLKANELKSNGKRYNSLTTELLKFNPHQVMGHESTPVDSSYTSGLLNQVGIECPKIDVDLMRKYMSYCEEVGYLS